MSKKFRRSLKLNVRLEEHAIERWRQYIGDDSVTRITREVKRHLHPVLEIGIPADLSVQKNPADRGFLLRLRPHLFAVVRPEVFGGWSVVTFHIGEILRGERGRGKMAEQIVDCPRCGDVVRLLEGFNVCEWCSLPIIKEEGDGAGGSNHKRKDSEY